ncbi:GlsB/YeaQ/YmgE family stress response membrane protein [Chryseobacterium sp. RP-3-3]|uniref:GlsB/YeaQ/YmgE family stress response membrane protein n=1 Tax=Chryseobacterium antibioticum TaxID=2728847 RepID=A0A7Y0FSG6_9FLAO|nr:GlsB/YeaQ/YmgE family stress response membrane protein [Chryseobacterium antibioticum]NML71218.1 GlsB/YeaQ/YmgE family stress response membrane protein [Chryseobacterium antibioticum]
MGILTWIIFGLIAGAIAKLIMPGTQGGGWLITIILGIIGAFVGGFVGSFLGWGTTDSFDFRSMLLAVGGALIVLWIYGMVTKKS